MVIPRAQARKRRQWLRLSVVVFLAIVFLVLIVPVFVKMVQSGVRPQTKDLVGGVFAVVVAVGGCWFIWHILQPAEPKPLDEQIDKLRLNLESSKQLIEQINAEFDLQAAAAAKIKAEADQNQRLAELNADQAQAVKNLVESVQEQGIQVGQPPTVAVLPRRPARRDPDCRSRQLRVRGRQDLAHDPLTPCDPPG